MQDAELLPNGQFSEVVVRVFFFFEWGRGMLMIMKYSVMLGHLQISWNCKWDKRPTWEIICSILKAKWLSWWNIHPVTSVIKISHRSVELEGNYAMSIYATLLKRYASITSQKMCGLNGAQRKFSTHSWDGNFAIRCKTIIKEIS